MRSYKVLGLLLVSLVSATLLFGQPAQRLIIEFIDGNNFSYTDPNGVSYSFPNGVMEGDAVPVGSVLSTGQRTSVELRLSPNGTIIKLAAGTTFQVDAVATPERSTNTFSLVAGKLRTVAARNTNFEVLTSTTVAAVRGTDFTLSFEDGVKSLLVVNRGVVEFAERSLDGFINPVLVQQGQFSEFFSNFTPSPVPQALFDEEYGDMGIPANRLPPEPEPQATEPEAEPEPEPEPEPVADSEDTPALASLEDPEAEARTREASSAVGDAILGWMQDYLGLEIGALTIPGPDGNQVWSKAVIQPTFNIGKLKMALYLPIIYQNNLFDPNDWYQPAGNNEWSFGFDYGWSERPLDALIDAAQDLALKIRYLEYGNQYRDPFFFKAGNVNSFTVGHGLIMRNYANDSDFPAVRHLGFNLGLDLGSWGFETMTNDLVQPEILGTRFYVRPVPQSKIAFGISAVADLYPATIFNTASDPDAAADYGSPVFLGLGLDLGIPVITSDLFSLRWFADAAAMVPYLRNDIAGSPGSSGFRYDMIWNGSSVTNWGAASGFMGNVAFLDWRLEYRHFTGAFKPAFFDAGYERRRMALVEEYTGYLEDGGSSIDQAPTVMGIYGEGGFSILRDRLHLELGYFWPFDIRQAADPGYLAASNDYFLAKLSVHRGLIPVLDISGAITYERRNFAPTLIGKGGANASLFDENTVFSGELVMPVPNAPMLNLAVIFSTTMARDENGDIQVKNDKPVMLPIITLETRLRF